jgi:hypothetical protein
METFLNDNNMNTKRPRKILGNPPSRDLIDEDLERYRQIALKSKGITDVVIIHQVTCPPKTGPGDELE